MYILCLMIILLAIFIPSTFSIMDGFTQNKTGFINLLMPREIGSTEDDYIILKLTCNQLILDTGINRSTKTF